MNKIKLGVVDIHLPDATSSYFFISEDFTSSLKVETNHDATCLIKKTLREKLERKVYNRIDFYSEGDAVTISISKADLMLQVAKILNQLAYHSVSLKEEEKVGRQLLSYKKPKKQTWKQGDIFMIPLQERTFAVSQVLEKNAFCALFDKFYTGSPNFEKEFSNKQIKAVVSILSENLDNHVYKVIDNKDLVISVPDTEEYDELRYGTHNSSFLEELAHSSNYKKQGDCVSGEVEEIISLQKY